MLTSEILNRIHVLLEKDTSYPTSTDEDYLVRLELVKEAVSMWAYDENTEWNELIISVQDAEDGDKTTDGTAILQCPTDFRKVIGPVIVGSGSNAIVYTRINPHKATEWAENNKDGFFITGNPKVGYKINLVNTIPETGQDVYYNYYKTPIIPSDGTDVPEISDPQFIIYWVLSELTKEDDPALASTYLQVAINKLDSMRLSNEQPTYYQENTIPDPMVGFGS
jgi:hypothetical protein